MRNAAPLVRGRPGNTGARAVFSFGPHLCGASPAASEVRMSRTAARVTDSPPQKPRFLVQQSRCADEAESELPYSGTQRKCPPYSSLRRENRDEGFSTVAAARNCGKLGLRRDHFDALASAHHLRYVREERATPLLRLMSSRTQNVWSRVSSSGLRLVSKRILRCRLVSTTRLYYKAFAETRPCP